MISIYYSKNDIEWTPMFYDQLLKQIPDIEQIRINKYMRWQDRQASIIGRLLLLQGLVDLNARASLKDIVYNKYNKPYLANGPFFNISHSGGFIVCCISNIPVGIDIEDYKDILIDDFKSIFTQQEWANIQTNCKFTNRLFYDYWTRKESVVKANGKGLGIPLNIVDVTQERVGLNGDVWFIKTIEIDPNYCCTLALSENSNYINIIKSEKFSESFK